MRYIFTKSLLIFLFLFHADIKGDSFQYNTYNNHGVLGLINMPTARFYDEAVHGVTIYDGTPDQKITLTSSPYNWLEASFFYTNIQGVPYPGFEYQDYKDKEGKKVFSFIGDSDAMIVKGLIKILSTIYNEKDVKEAIKIDPIKKLKLLNLNEHISSQRSNGLNSIILKIKDFLTKT